MIQVGIIMGSKSDLPVMKEAKEFLDEIGISCELKIVSAHRTPELMIEYAQSAASRGLKVIIAGAGGAAHLPGMTASMTSLPVIGVPIKSSNSIDGWDSILSILQIQHRHHEHHRQSQLRMGVMKQLSPLSLLASQT